MTLTFCFFKSLLCICNIAIMSYVVDFIMQHSYFGVRVCCSFISVVGDIIELFCWMDYGHYLTCMRAYGYGDVLFI